MKIHICEQTFNPWRAIEEYQGEMSALNGQYGATAVFVGSLRDVNLGDEVVAMQLEHYPGMTERQLEHIVNQAHQRWAILDCLLIHRVGRVVGNDTLVLVAVWAAHRGDAFDASRFIMEALKSQAPFWKKETLKSGESRWVEKNSDGYLHQP